MKRDFEVVKWPFLSPLTLNKIKDETVILAREVTFKLHGVLLSDIDQCQCVLKKLFLGQRIVFFFFNHKGWHLKSDKPVLYKVSTVYRRPHAITSLMWPLVNQSACVNSPSFMDSAFILLLHCLHTAFTWACTPNCQPLQNLQRHLF